MQPDLRARLRLDVSGLNNPIILKRHKSSHFPARINGSLAKFI
jgi:hypothetical protein